ncbi:hypothetical protein DRQ53_13785 [bacterium]|nr:MAG: hypothetical protein DRQ53_13785 [bacterium]
MAYPPLPPPNDRLNTTPQVDNHPSDHNVTADAITDINNELGDNPKGTFADVEARLDAMIPAGVMWDFGGTTAPSSWVLCDGDTYDGTLPQYEKLWAAIGNTWGGTGESAFKVPDLRGASSIGFNDQGGIAATVGSTGGQIDVKEHTHIQNEHFHADGSYAVDIDHGHSDNFTTGDENSHEHVDGVGGGFVMSGTGGATQYNVPIGPGYNFSEAQTTGGSQDPHNHAVDGGVTALNVANKSIVGNSADATATNQNTGAGIDNMNPYGVCLKIISLGGP